MKKWNALDEDSLRWKDNVRNKRHESLEDQGEWVIVMERWTRFTRPATLRRETVAKCEKWPLQK